MTATGWRVQHLELNDLRSLTLEPGYDGLYVCFWHDGMPLGHQELHASELPLSEVQAKILAVRAIAPAVSTYLRQDVFRSQENDAPCLGELLHTERPLE